MCFLIYGELMTENRYPENCPPKENSPRLGIGFGSKSGLVLGLGATRQLPPKKIVSRLGLGLSLGLVLGLGAIFIGGNCPRILKTMDEKMKI